MKLNGKINIITDNDIVTTGRNAGSNLNTVIENIKDDVTKLKRNLKFIYEHGSVGGGGGSGSGVSKWAITATLGGKTISNGNIISLTPGENSYPLVISISGGSGDYSVLYSYGKSEYTVKLNADNNWRHSIPLTLTDNGTISIEATDNILVKNVYADYITNPYSFGDLKIVNEGWEEYPTSDIFIEDAIINGLGISCTYNIAINAKTTYDWYFNEVHQDNYSGELDGISSGTFVLPISDEYLKPEMANAYNVRFTITIQPENQDFEVITKNISFNLIPNNIYLKLAPQTGIVYDAIQEEDYYEFSTNREIAFNCRIYNGPNTGKTGGIISAVAEGGDSEEITGYSEGTTVTLKILFKTPGWKAITFNYSLEGNGSVTKYLYCRQIESEFNWFKQAVPTKQNYYRGWEETTCVGMSVTNNTYVQMTTASEEVSYPFTYSSDGCNLLLNLGIQYNNINDYRQPIAIFYNNAGNPFATIYQNKIEFESVYSSPVSCQFFLNKEMDFTPGDPDKYHLITIALSSVWRDRTHSLDYNEITVYLDGVLEGAVSDFTPATVILGGITLCPGSYSINHIDASYFAPTSNYERILYDTDANYYFYSYKSKSRSITIDEDTTSILNFLYDVQTKKVNYSVENNLVKVDSTLYDNVAKHCDIPTLVFKTNRKNTEYNVDIVDWMNTGYTDTSSSTSPSKYKIALTEVRWGRNKTATSKIVIPKSVGQNTYFYLKLQGSSTMGYKAKNFTFGIEAGSDLAENVTPIFSPNFKVDDPKTFLHEKEWTLKADAVDSSHTNNVAMGRFINDYNNFSYDIAQTGVNENILSHVRKCLDGFPVLVYLETQSANVADTYFLGIYSFNLGRDSYFNLGYSDLSQLDPNYLTDASNNTFSFTVVGTGDSRGIDPLDGFVAAEVQDNIKFWDFSQYDDSVLFSRNNENANFMFGDIKTSAGYVNAERDIKNFVKSVAGAGGFLFKSMGKTLDPVHSYLDDNDNIVENHMQDNQVAYHIAGHVPSCKWQYSRINDQYTPYRGDLWNNSLNIDLLENCIGSIDPESEIVPTLNYQSLAYYYTTCMVGGLVDSVQKNLTIKKWKDSFGTFFYDIDTALGRDNDGNKSSYFAFSDYWFSNIDEYDADGNKIDRITGDTTPAARTVNRGCTVYRDYVPVRAEGQDPGYDIPSSYLFAIAKYVNCKGIGGYSENANYISPQDIYATWRQSGNILSTADNFIDTYFASNLDGVPECLLNLNYRNKYLYNTTGTQFDKISGNLHGRGVEEVRDWLTGRLHILDAYFNLSSEDINITNTYKEPKPTVVVNNPDIYIIKDVFRNPNDTRSIRRSGTITFTVTANDYTPLVISMASGTQRFLLEKKEVPYEITVSPNNADTNFGGSQLWTSLDTINGFVTSLTDRSTFNFNTDRIDTLVGDSGSVTTTWNVNAPFVKEIKLNSPNYSGALNIDSTAYNVDKIDISKSKIALTVTDSKVSEINCSNLNGAAELNILRCKNLKSVNLTNANANKCEISPIWTSSINLSNNRIKELTVTGNIDLTLGNLTVQNNGYLERLTFARFEAVNLNNASNVKKITCNDDPNSSMLTSFTAQNCTKLTSIELPVDNLVTLNLSGCSNLTEIVLKGSDFSKLSTLNLSGTKVSSITFNNESPASYLDLTRFTNLGKASSGTSINLSKDEAVVAIKFRNDENSPVRLTNNFQGCTNLERVYGNVSICTNSCFYGLNKFSIHGSDLSNLIWNGSSVLNGTKVKHPNDIKSGGPSIYFVSGSGNVTNMTFGVSDVRSCFTQTNCTIFDYYYMLANIGSARDLGSLFSYNRNNTYGHFDGTTGNSPDKRIFMYCTNVTSCSGLFSYHSSGKIIYLTSPTVVNGSVTDDDGLFSYLTSCTNIGAMFYASYSFIFDRFLFRRKTENYLFTNIDYYTPRYVLNAPPSDFSWSTIANIYSNVTTMTGNITDIFKNVPNLNSMSGFLYQIEYLDLNSDFKIPSNVSVLNNAFSAKIAVCDNFVLSNYFKTPANLQYLRSSFRATNTSASSVNMEMDNNSFSAFTNLREFGLGTSPYSETSINSSCFTGYNKTISSVFPFDIFSRNTLLEKAIGVFINVTSIAAISDLQLPGTLFKYNTRLQDVSGIFFDFGVDYSLSDDVNFKNCPNIKVLDYTFGSSIVNNVRPHLSGQIPYKFFWHGETIDGPKTYYGTNETEEGDDGIVYVNPQAYNVTIKSATQGISSMKYCFQHSNISAYVNTNNIEIEDNPNYHPYRYVSASLDGPFVDELSKVDTRKYTFIWAFDGEHYPTIYTNTSKDDYEVLDRTMPATFELSDRIINCVKISLGDGGIGNYSQNNTYIAPPDLLRYCNNDCEIKGLFSGSGLSGWNRLSGWNMGDFNMYGYGLTGRICPYMLKPVPNTTDVSEMFRYCKKLSYYRILEGTGTIGKAYMIPNEFFTYATKVTALNNMFEDTLQPQYSDINDVFKPLTGTINISSIFYSTYWDSQDNDVNAGGNYTDVDAAFKTNDVSSTTNAFCITTSTTTSNGRPMSQKIRFNDVFNSKYSKELYSNNSNYFNTFRGYYKLGSGTDNERFGTKTLYDSSTTNNYYAF